MIQAIVNRQISKAERNLGVSLEYARYMARVSLPAFWRVARFTKLLQARHSAALRDALHVASIVSAMGDDCGSCVQIGVRLARRAGVERDVVAAVVHRESERLPADLRDVYHFADAVMANRDDQHELRERVRRRFGERGLVELSEAIAMHRVFPTLKRALGYATTCARVTVEV